MFFDKPETQERISDTGALGEPATFLDRTKAAFDAARDRNAFQASGLAITEAYDARIKAIRDATGADLANPMRRVDTRTPSSMSQEGFGLPSDPVNTDPLRTTGSFEFEFQKELERLAEKHPDKRDIIAPHKPVRQSLAKEVGDREQRSIDAGRNYGGTFGTGPIADFAGGMGAAAVDPVNAATFLIGPTGRVAQGYKAILAMGVKQGIANAGVEAAMAPLVQDFRRQMGLSYGLSEAAMDVAAAGALGVAFDAGARTLARGVQASLGRKAILDPQGKVTGYESAEASAARAKRAEEQRLKAEQLKALQDDGTLAKAMEGDPEALAKVDPILGLSEDPAVRGAMQARSFVEMEPGELDGIVKQRNLEQALRAAMDADEPPPVIRIETPSKRPSLSDEMEIPKGTEGNQHFRTIDIDGKPVRLQNIDPKSLTTDAEAFQFKSGGDARGVTGALGLNTTFDPAAAGRVMVFERGDGVMVIVDGHQRLSIARDGDQFQGFVFREADGWTPDEVRAEASLKNIQEGRAGLLDAVRAVREHGSAMEGRLDDDTDFMRQVMALSRLSDSALARVEAGTIEPSMAALVGELVPDQAKHDGVIQALMRANPSTEAAARKIIGREIREPVIADDLSLVMGASIAEPHVIEARADVLAGVLTTLRGEPGYIGDVETQAVAKVISRLADRAGLVADTLSQAGRAVAEGQPLERAIDATLRRFEQVIADAGVNGLADQPVRLASISNALDMSPEARKARAEAMGFDTSKVWYHGTTKDFEAFDPKKANKANGMPRAVFFADEPSTANYFARSQDGSRAIPVYLKRGEYFDFRNESHAAELEKFFDGKASSEIVPGYLGSPKASTFIESMKRGDWGILERPAVQKWLKKNGYVGWFARESADGPLTVAVTDPTNIRSINAAFDPAKADSPVLLAALQDVDTGRSMRRDLDALGYYSKALEAAKAIPQAKGTPEQMLAALKKAGVKDAEIEATNLAAFLEGKKSITSDEIVKHLTENRVGVREVVNERRGEDHPAIRTAEDVRDQTRWSSYSLDPSNPTYRETVLHLPERGEGFEELDGALNRLKVERDEIESRIGHDVSNASKADMDAYDDIVARIDQRREALRKNQQETFRSGHFSEPNIIGHMMTSMTKHEGRPVYTIDQIQSDWGQKLRDGGVRDEAKIAELKAKLKEVVAKHNPALDAWKDFAMKLREGRDPVDWPPTMSDGDLSGGMRKAENWFASNRITLSPEQRADFQRLFMGLEYGRRDVSLISAELYTAERSAPGHPLVNTTDQWTTTTLRRALRQAVEADAEFIAIPHGDTVLSYNPGDAKGMRGFYGSDVDEGIVPKNLRKLLEKMDKDAAKPTKVEKLETSNGLEGWQGESDYGNNKPKNGADANQTGFTLFPLTDKVKRSVMEEGQPLFAKQDAPQNIDQKALQDFSDNLETVLREAQQPSPPRLVSDLKDAKAHTEELRETMAQEIKEATDPVTAEAKMLSSIPDLDPSKPLLYTAKANELQAEIRKEIDRTIQMLPPDVRIRVEDQLVFSGLDAPDQRIAGLWDGYDRIVYVAMSGADPVRAIRHEVIHALRQSGLLTDAEFNQLYAFAEKLKLRKAYGIDAKYKDLYTKAYGERGADYIENLLREETVADMFSDYSLNGRRFGDVSGGGLVDRLIDKIVAFMKLLRDNLGFLGFRDINSIFQAIESGEVAARPSARNPAGGRNADVVARQIGEAMGGDPRVMFTFAGENAKTADLDALAKAKQMDAEGKPREAIWTDTGWFKGVDGKWRFEISDLGAGLTKPLEDIREVGRPMPLDMAFDHKPLFDAYPAARDAEFYPTMDYGPGEASFTAGSPSLIRVGYDDGNKFASHMKAPSATLHELQHFIQRVGEGDFAKGGTPRLFAQDVKAADQMIEIVNKNLRDIVKMKDAAKTPTEKAELQTRYDNLMSYKLTELVPRAMVDPVAQYRKLAGEVEARAVQTRQNMTPEERRARPPWLDYDVPEPDQIVRMAGEGPQLSTGQRPSDMLTAALAALPEETATAIRNLLRQYNIDEARLGPMIDQLMPLIRSGDQAAVAERMQTMAQDADPVMMPPQTEFGRDLASVQADRDMTDVIGACRL